MTSKNESRERGTVFFGCVFAGILLMIPAMFLHEALIHVLEKWRLAPQGWGRALTGLIFAFTPVTLLTLWANRLLHRKYPDSLPRRIPEPHERPSAHRLDRFQK